MLCPTCKAMLEQISLAIRDVVSGSHHKTARKLLLASLSGCNICMNIETRIRSKKLPFLFDPEIQTYLSFVYAPSSIDIHINGIPSKANEFIKFHRIPIAYFIESNQQDADAGTFDQDVIQNLSCYNTGDAQVIRRGRWWYENCCKAHEQCEEGRVPTYFPPRLLDLNGEVPALIDSGSVHPTGCYAALSYCWGRHPRHLKLTAENMNRLYSGIPVRELPKTFQDAIEVSKTLNITYLWIDSLCILQKGPGSQDDWQRHLSEMASVYSNCVLNIAADFGEDADSGLFYPRDPLSIQPCVINLETNETEQPESLRLSSNKDIHVLMEGDFWSENIGNSVLFGRAWVYQERFLSPRTLHFGEQQLFWECSKPERLCETFPNAMPRFRDEETPLPYSWRNDDEMTDIHQQWYDVVRSCSKGRITHLEDRLPAIAGVAERVSRILNEKYVAGFFTSQLPHALLWKPVNHIWGVREPYRAPTWSWASVEGEVEILPWQKLGPRSVLATVEDITVQLVNKRNPFGQITSASITLRAPLFPVSWEENRVNIPDPIISLPVGLPNPEDVQLQFDESSFAQDRLAAVVLYICTSLFFEEGLILIPHRGKPGCYTRIGTFWAYPHSSSDVATRREHLKREARAVTIL